MAILPRQTRALSPVTPYAVVSPTLVFVHVADLADGKTCEVRGTFERAGAIFGPFADNGRPNGSDAGCSYVLTACTRDGALE